MTRWVCAACLAMLLAMLLAACSKDGTTCEYDGPTTGTVKIDAIGSPIDINGADCFAVKYEWVTNGPSRFPAFDQVYASKNCLDNQGFDVGSTFEVSRQDERQGTCTPSIRVVTTSDIAMCVMTCTAPTN